MKLNILLVAGAILMFAILGAAPVEPARGLRTQVRAADTEPRVITLAQNEVFRLRGQSARQDDTVQVTFEKGGDSFQVALLGFNGAGLDLLSDSPVIPLRGPATVTITGRGLVSYEIQPIP
jgi:hypothetical protein